MFRALLLYVVAPLLFFCTPLVAQQVGMNPAESKLTFFTWPLLVAVGKLIRPSLNLETLLTKIAA
jgi:hypothetical protein